MGVLIKTRQAGIIYYLGRREDRGGFLETISGKLIWEKSQRLQEDAGRKFRTNFIGTEAKLFNSPQLYIKLVLFFLCH